MLIVKLSTTRNGLPPNASHSTSQMTSRPTPLAWALLTSGWAASIKRVARTGRHNRHACANTASSPTLCRHSPDKAPEVASSA